MLEQILGIQSLRYNITFNTYIIWQPSYVLKICFYLQKTILHSSAMVFTLVAAGFGAFSNLPFNTSWLLQQLSILIFFN